MKIRNVECGCGEDYYKEYKVDKPQKKFEKMRIVICNKCGHRWNRVLQFKKKKFQKKRSWTFDKNED